MFDIIKEWRKVKKQNKTKTSKFVRQKGCLFDQILTVINWLETIENAKAV